MSAVFACVLTLCGTGHAQSIEAVNEKIDAINGGAESFAAAFDALQAAVTARDAATVAALVTYPIRVEIDGDRVTLRRDTDLIERFDAVFTPEVSALVSGQDYADLMVNEDGIFFGASDFRMTSYCADRSCSIRYWLVRAIGVSDTD